MSKKLILCLDFDGVIHSYTSGWKGATCIPDTPVEGALEFIANAVNYFEVNIYSSRSRYLFGRRAMKKWLYNAYFSLGIKNTPKWVYRQVTPNAFADPWQEELDWGIGELIRKIKFPSKKPAAFLLIDDRCICFNGKFPSVEEIQKFIPWYKK